MVSLSDMSRVDLQDGHGPRRIEGLSWSPVSHLWEATMTDPRGNAMFLGQYETPTQAVEAIERMTESFQRMEAFAMHMKSQQAEPVQAPSPEPWKPGLARAEAPPPVE